MEVVNYGDVHGDSTESVHTHVGGIHVRHIVLILSAVMPACEDVVPVVIVRRQGHRRLLTLKAHTEGKGNPRVCLKYLFFPNPGSAVQKP